MKSHFWIAAVVIAPTLFAGTDKQSCPMGPVEQRDPSVTYHQLSVTAEAVTGGRHHAVTPPPASQIVYPQNVNFIDTEIFAKMKKDGVAPSLQSSDSEFLRRVYLDLTGQIPDVATVQSFLADKSADKRARVIDQLIGSDPYVDRWTMWFGDLVQNVQLTDNSREQPQGRNAYYNYIKDAIKTSKAFDQMVHDVLSAKGESFTDATGATNYWVRQMQPNGPIQDTYDNLAAASCDKFLGMPCNCFSCHNGLAHLDQVNTYLKSKTRYDFWGNAAFFSTTRARVKPNTPQPAPYEVLDNPGGAYQLNTTSGNKTPRVPVNGQNTVPPAFLLTGEGPRDGEPWRDAYARILTAHPQFARATVNRIWKEMFGLAIIEPTNNIDLNRLDPNKLPAGFTVQPTHPALLEQLTTEFIANKYDLRWLLRTIAVSNAYQLSARYTQAPWKESSTPYFARHLPHRVMAEALLDAVTRATNVPITYTVSGGVPPVQSAMKLPDTLEMRNNNTGRFLDSFGRGNRDDDPRDTSGSIAQSLALMNDNQMVVSRVRRTTANSTVARTLAATSDPAAITDALYLATLSRYPSDSEKQQAVAYLRSGTLAQKTEDLQWVLLNTLEFLFD